jgi:threonine 3-dehydrogenase
MRVLVTGGTGFIGAELARTLVERGEEVVLFHVTPSAPRIDDIRNKVTVVQGNLAYWPEVFNVIKDYGIEGIYHLGSMLSVPSNANPWASFQANVVGTMHVLEGARLFGVSKVAFTSTVATYGLDCPATVTDISLQRPTTMYGCGKLYGECLGRFYRSKFGLDFRSVRLPAIVGPGAKVKHVSQYNAWMIEYAALGKPFTCFVTEDTKSPVMYFKDAAKAVDMLFQAPREHIRTVNYNVAGVTPNRTAKQIEQVIRKHIPEAQITYDPEPDIMEFHRTMQLDVFDDTTAREEWGWQPSYPDFDTLVTDFIEEIRVRPGRYGLA